MTEDEHALELSPERRELLQLLLTEEGEAAEALGKPRSIALPIPPANRQAGVPVSFVQERVWITDLVVQAGAGASTAEALRLYGPLDETALKRSIAEIVRRHEVLR